MNRLRNLRLSLAALVAALLVVTGCRPAGFFAPLGEQMRPGGGFGDRAQAPRTATLLVTVHWPRRDLPGFKAAAIPTSTNTLVITVGGAGRQPVSKAVSRPAGPVTGPVPVSMQVPEGDNLTVDVKAYSEADPVPANAQPVAQGTAAIPQALAGKLVNVPITLTATFAPTITKLSAYGSPTSVFLTVEGTNFGTGAVPCGSPNQGDGNALEIRFGGTTGLAADCATVTRENATKLVVRIPAQAVTGPIVVVADGIPSEENTIFWVMGGEPSITISVNGNYKSVVLANGASASIKVEQNLAFRFPVGKTAADFTGQPLRQYELSNSAIATVSIGTGDTDTVAGLSAGTTALKARVGSVYSNVDTQTKLSVPLDVTVTKGFTLATIAGKGGGIGDGGSAASAELLQPMGIALASNGDLLVADQGHHRIRRLGTTASTEAGTGFVGLVDGAAGSAKFSGPAGLALDASGSLYVADSANHVIRKVSAGTVTTFAGAGTEGFSGNGVTATLGQMAYPQGLAIAPGGHLIIADTYNHCIRIVAASDGAPYGFSMNTGNIYTLAGTPATAGFADGTRLQAKFDTPAAVAIDASGSILVADSGNNRIRKITTDGMVTTVAGDGEGDFGGDGGLATAAKLFNPSGVAIDASGSIYVSDTGNHRIRLVTEGASISTVAGTGTAGTAGDNGAATAALLSSPKALAYDASGSLYVADFGTNRIRKIVLSTGIITTAAGSGTGDGADALDTPLAGPIGVTLDPDGKVIVVDTDRNQVRRIESNGTFSLVAGTGVTSFDGDGGDPKAAGFNQPSAARFDSAGVMYIVDSRNRRIRAIGPAAGDVSAFGATIAAGKVTTVAGGGSSTFAEGAAIGNTLLNPVAIAFSAGGDMYISDSGANAIYKVARTGGQMTRVAGLGGDPDQTAGYSGDNSAATSAKLQSPRGLVIEADGSILFADGQNHAIRRVAPNGIIDTVAGNGTANFTGDNGEAKSAQLNSPWDIVLDGGGGFFITDSGNHAVRWVTSAGTITTIAGTGQSAGFLGDGGNALAGKLFSPKGLARTSAGVLIFADTGNHRIRKLTSQ